ncbi:MAG: GtrA family protein [Candidatus Thalassarchaeaceae archaeon]|jgi:putative flippase GtrA|nr:GtrA family protein [Candidatus Thalassarchaeaceae archaeon]MDP7091819.1 GtrA family protein [Candidatus Thalassarchaeaceae archaeon]MDP7256492.1 GtrA family protein [Candidatus Thalassarchaeaceae archaeon]MDP7445866.1 GtrA family protein [Candidatus Thalassarchaeaceae archaeon]MDP7648840.1 GtrA family protein [Candidatus Thalassarchaeaceae archaeon]
MLVSEDYPWGKLLREYATYCAVGCINVIAFFILYYWLYEMRLSEGYPAATAWAVSYFLSSWQAHYLHRWLTFESPTGYAKSLFVMMAIYAILLVISTASTAYFADILGVNHLYSWAANTAAFGFLSFLALRTFAFPLSDGRITRQERLEELRNRRRA